MVTVVSDLVGNSAKSLLSNSGQLCGRCKPCLSSFLEALVIHDHNSQAFAKNLLRQQQQQSRGDTSQISVHTDLDASTASSSGRVGASRIWEMSDESRIRVMERDRRRAEEYNARNARQGCNSIDIFLGPESGPEPGTSHVWSFQTCLNLKYPSTELGPEHGPVLSPVSCPKFKMSIEFPPRVRPTRPT